MMLNVVDWGKPAFAVTVQDTPPALVMALARVVNPGLRLLALTRPASVKDWR
jgi:hypothetical protein